MSAFFQRLRALLPAEPEDLLTRRHPLRHRRIIGIQHNAIAVQLIGKESHFRCRVLFKRSMAIQMVRREIQQDANVGTKRFDVFELKTAHLRHSDTRIGR